MLVRMWRNKSSWALLVGMQIGAATVESSMELPQKIKDGTAFWPSDSTSGNISEETQNNTNSKEYIHPYVHCSIIYNSQDMEAAQVPISIWVDKKAAVHLHNWILLGCKKGKNFILSDSMDGLREHYAK